MDAPEAVALSVQVGPVRMRVASGSMRPCLSRGDWITLAACHPESLQCGDIVALRAGDNVLVHRFLAWRGGRRHLLTRGDACQGADEPQPLDRLIGRVVAIERKSGARREIRAAGWRQIHRGAGVASLLVVAALHVARSAVAGLRGAAVPPRPGYPTRELAKSQG